ncbi:MAG: prepilin-type N-terminal cleavage/methylation domain-containing protein [Thermoleophilia bacterium]
MGKIKFTGHNPLHQYRSPGTNRAACQQGFTAIEIIITLSLLGVLMAMSVSGLSYYQAGRSMDVAQRDLITQIREAQSMAVATGNTYRIDFSDPSRLTYQLQYRSGSGWVNVRAPESLPAGVQFSLASPPSFGGDAYLEFYARGTCESGQLSLTGKYGKSNSIQVDGETANIRTF